MALDLSIQVHEFTLLKKNLLFAEQHKNEMLLKLQNEVKLGRILGPFKNMPIKSPAFRSKVRTRILKFFLPLLTMTLKHRMPTITMDTGMAIKTMLSETGPLVIKIITF
jgi:hypothetical protein